MTLKKDVILLTSNLYRPHFGGVENSLFHLAYVYKEMGKIPIIVVSDISPDKSPLPKVEITDGITIYRYSMSEPVYYGKIKLPKVLSGIINCIRLYKEVIQKYQPRLTVTRYHYNQLLYKFAGGTKTVYLVPGVVKFQNVSKNVSAYSFKKYVQWYYHLMLQYFAFRSCDRLAVFSQNMSTQVLAIIHPKREMLLTKPGVDGKRFSPLNIHSKTSARNELGLNCNGHVFLCVGRCVAAKGFDLAIKAFAGQKDTENELWLIGDGELLHCYQRLALNLGIEKQVRFIGSTLQPEKYYRAADTFLMSSVFEPLGQTILEALASGLAIVAFEPSQFVNTASRELLNEDCTIFVNNTVSDLAQAIERQTLLSAEDYQRISSSAREHAVKNYSWNNLAEDLLTSIEYEK